MQSSSDTAPVWLCTLLTAIPVGIAVLLVVLFPVGPRPTAANDHATPASVARP